MMSGNENIKLDRGGYFQNPRKSGSKSQSDHLQLLAFSQLTNAAFSLVCSSFLSTPFQIHFENFLRITWKNTALCHIVGNFPFEKYLLMSSELDLENGRIETGFYIFIIIILNNKDNLHHKK